LFDTFIIIRWFRLLYNNEKDKYIQSSWIFIINFILNIIFQALYLNYIIKELKEKNDNIINKDRLKIDQIIYGVTIFFNVVLLVPINLSNIYYYYYVSKII